MSAAARLRSLLAILSAVSLGACLFPDDDAPVKAIVPLAAGNTWAYVDSAYYGGDSITLDSTHIDVTGTRPVALSGGLQTVYLWNIRNRATGLPGALTLWLQNRADGNYTVGAEQDTASFVFETRHVKYPAVTGERYGTFFLSFRAEEGGLVPAIDTIETEVVNADSVCTVPAGTFRCVHYRGWRPGGILHADAWYAPGVGFLGSKAVRTTNVNGTDRQVAFIRRLASYTLVYPLY